MKFAVIACSIFFAAPLGAQNTYVTQSAVESRVQSGPARSLITLRVDLSLSGRQIAALQGIAERYEAQNRGLRAAMDADRISVVQEEQQSQRGGARSQQNPSSARASRDAARDAAIQLRTNEAREAAEAEALLTEAQLRILRPGSPPAGQRTN